MIGFLILPFLTAFFCLSFFLGGAWLGVTIAAIWLIAVFLDELFGDEEARDPSKPSLVFDIIVYSQLPTLAGATFLAAYYLSDWTFLGPTIDAARARTGPIMMVVIFYTLGLLYGIVGINVAHELVHRNNRLATATGRWLLSFSVDTGFALEHVYGHHRYVGTSVDPATARRGQSFWNYLAVMMTLANYNAWAIERTLLGKRGRPAWSLSNRFIVGQAMSACWLVLFYAAAGLRGVLAFVAMALIGKTCVELTNYIQHYGLVRVDGTRIAYRHAWNSRRLLSNWLLINLPKHSDHHVKPAKPFWQLSHPENAPVLPYGYFVMSIAAVFPPLWRRVMRAPLESWDRDHATPEELAIVNQTGSHRSAMSPPVASGRPANSPTSSST